MKTDVFWCKVSNIKPPEWFICDLLFLWWQAAMDFVVEEDLKAHLTCWYIQKYVKENPQPQYFEHIYQWPHMVQEETGRWEMWPNALGLEADLQQRTVQALLYRTVALSRGKWSHSLTSHKLNLWSNGQFCPQHRDTLSPKTRSESAGEDLSENDQANQPKLKPVMPARNPQDVHLSWTESKH